MQRNFDHSMRQTAQSLRNLTTGKRVNNAADDVGAFSMTQSMQAEQTSRRMSMRNIGGGLSLLERAESGVAEIISHLTRLRELAVQASTETLNVADRAIMQNEFQAQMESLDMVAESVNFNTSDLLVSYNVDLGLLVDVSGSMGGEITNVKNSIGNLVSKVENSNIDLKLGMAHMGADPAGGDNVTKVADMDDPDIVFDNALNQLNTSYARTGMDPWSSLVNLASPDTDRAGFTDPDAFDWRDGSEVKSIVVITDTGREYQWSSGNLGTESETMSTMIDEDITVHTIGGSHFNGNSSYDSREVMTNITNATNGTFTFTDQAGNQVQDALDTIATDLIDKYRGSKSIAIQGGPNQGEDNILLLDTPFDYTSAALSMGDLDVSTLSGAQTAVDSIDAAMQRVQDGRSRTGALYNRLLHMYNFEQANFASNEAVKISAVDVDVAEETSILQAHKLRSEIGLASLAQARDLSLIHVQNILKS